MRLLLPALCLLVTLLSLRAQDEEKVADREASAIAGAITSATYEGRVEERGGRAFLEIEATILAESFRDDWAVVPLGDLNLSITDSRTGGARLRKTDAGLDLLLPVRGEHTINLTLRAPIKTEDGTQSVELKLPVAPISKWEILVPGKDKKFSLDENIVWTSRNEEDSSRLSFHLQGSERLDLKWEKIPETPQEDAQFITSTELVSVVRPGTLETTATIRFQFLRGSFRDITLRLPAGQTVKALNASHVEQWDVSKEAKGTQTLLAELMKPISMDYELEVIMESAFGGLPAEVTLPALEIAGARSQSGTVKLVSDPSLDVVVETGQSVIQEAGREPSTGDYQVGSYRFLNAKLDLAMKVEKMEPLIQVSTDAIARVQSELILLQSSHYVRISRAGVGEITLEMPAGFDQTVVKGHEVDYFQQKGNQLRIRFERPVKGDLNFTIESRGKKDPTELSLVTPLIHVPGANLHEAKLGISVPDMFEAQITREGKLGTMDSRVFLAESGHKLDSGFALPLAFQYEQVPAELVTVSLSEKLPEISARIQTLADIRGEKLTWRWDLEWIVENAGVPELMVQIPEAISPDLTVLGEAPDLERDWWPEEYDPPEGEVFWKLTFPERRKGTIQLSLELVQDIPALQLEDTLPLKVPTITLPDSWDTTGTLTVRGDLGLAVGGEVPPDWVASDSTDEPDPRLLQAWTYPYFGEAVTLQLVRERAVETTPEIIVETLGLATLVTEDGFQRTALGATIRGAGELELMLPQHAALISEVQLGDKTIPVMRSQDGARLKIALGSESGHEDLFMTWEIPPEAPMMERDQVRLPVPIFLNAKVLETSWEAGLPDRFAYRDVVTDMGIELPEVGWERFQTLLRGAQDQGTSVNWFDETVIPEGRVFHLSRAGAPTPAEALYMSRSVAMAIQSAAGLLTFCLGLLLTRARLGGKIIYLMLGASLVLVVSVLVSPYMAPLWDAVALGMVAAIAVWMIHGFWTVLSRTHASSVKAAEVHAEPEKPEPEAKAVREAPRPITPMPEVKEVRSPLDLDFEKDPEPAFEAPEIQETPESAQARSATGISLDLPTESPPSKVIQSSPRTPVLEKASGVSLDLPVSADPEETK